MQAHQNLVNYHMLPSLLAIIAKSHNPKGEGAMVRGILEVLINVGSGILEVLTTVVTKL